MKIKTNIELDGHFLDKEIVKFVVYLHCLPRIGDRFSFKNIDVPDWIKQNLWKVYYVGHQIDINSHEIEIFLEHVEIV